MTTYLTPDVANAILGLVRTGHRVLTAIANKVGIHPQTLTTWLNKGNPETALRDGCIPEEPYVSFYNDWCRAKAEATILVEGHFLSHTASDPKMALKWLEREAPEVYAPTPEANPAAVAQLTLEDAVKRLSTEELRQLQQLIVKASNTPTGNAS
jgi:hypothetical protein